MQHIPFSEPGERNKENVLRGYVVEGVKIGFRGGLEWLGLPQIPMCSTYIQEKVYLFIQITW